jgi:branched-subunit amino acid transport protein AzlD
MAALIPIADGIVIIHHRGFAAPLLIHWGTAIYMAVVSYFLLRHRNSQYRNMPR